MGLEPHIMPIGTGDSSSSARSSRSIQSNTTVKAISPPPTSSSTAFPYTVGRLSTFHDTDTDMDDPFSMPTHVGHHRHRIDSQGVPIPPARTTSLGQHGHSNSISSSDTSLPSVQVTTATLDMGTINTNIQIHSDMDHWTLPKIEDIRFLIIHLLPINSHQPR
jgi:hypothetical protein